MIFFCNQDSFSAPVTWSVDEGNVATISAETGIVTISATGTATFTASAGGKQASVAVEVQEATNVIDAVWDWTKLSAAGERGQFKNFPASLRVLVSANSVVTIVISASNKSLKIAGEEKSSDTSGKYTWKNETGKTGYILVEQTGTEVYFYSITVTNLDRSSLNYETNVAALPAISISSANNATSVTVGETLQLTAAPSNFGQTPTIAWASSDTSKATVSDSGLVTGVAASDGSVTITATATNGSGDSAETATATYALKVKTEGGKSATVTFFDSSKTYSASGTVTAGSKDIVIKSISAIMAQTQTGNLMSYSNW